MRNFDFTPLYRHSVGFDRLANALDNMLQTDQSTNAYPPFNIEKLDEHSYRISIAVAGFAEDELTIETKEGYLTVTGVKAAKDEAAEPKYLHRGIAERAFERRFQLADHVKVVDARLENGLLHIALEREVPEALKPRQIEIKGTAKKISKKN